MRRALFVCVCLIGLGLSGGVILADDPPSDLAHRTSATSSFGSLHKVPNAQVALAAVKTSDIVRHNKAVDDWRRATRGLSAPRTCAQLIPWMCAANSAVSVLFGDEPLPGCEQGLKQRMAWDRDKWAADNACVGLYKMGWRAAERFDAFSRQQHFDRLGTLDLARRFDPDIEEFLFGIALGRATQSTLKGLHCGNLTQTCQPHLWADEDRVDGEWSQEARLLKVVPREKEFCNAVSEAGLLYGGPRPLAEPVCYDLHMAFSELTDRDDPTAAVSRVLGDHAWTPYEQDPSERADGERRFRFLEEN